MYRLLIFVVAIFGVGKLASAQIRLKSEVHYRFIGLYLPSDSIVYHYSSNRGGVANNVILHDSAISYFNYDRVVQIFNSNDSVIERRKQQMDINGGYITISREEFGYDANRKLITTTQYTTDGGVEYLYGVIHYSYNRLGNIAGRLTLHYNRDTQTLDSVYNDTYIYNTGGVLLMINNDAKNDGRLQFWKRDIFNYNASGKCTARIGQRFDKLTRIWEESEKSLYHYDNYDNVISHYYLQNWSRGFLDTAALLKMSYDSIGNLISSVVMTRGLGRELANDDSTYYIYNSNNCLTFQRTLQWIYSTWTATANTISCQYYYEPYTPNGVAEIRNTEAQLQLYPVPAGNMLYLQMNAPQQQVYTVHVTDMQGRQVLHSSYLGNTRQGLDISALPAGIYTIQLMDTKGGVQHSKFTIQR